jgi:hypothetical protein
LKCFGFVVIESRNFCGKLVEAGLNSLKHPWALAHGQSKFMVGVRI